MSETVWILPRTDGTADAHGNVTPSWPADPTDPGAVQVDGAYVAPRTDLAGEAAIADREAVVTNKRLLIPPGQPIPEPVDRMWVRDATYDVIGEPGTWVYYQEGRQAGTEVALKRVEG